MYVPTPFLLISPQYRCLILRGHLDSGYSPKVAKTFTLKRASSCQLLAFSVRARQVYSLHSVAQPPENEYEAISMSFTSIGGPNRKEADARDN